jgi:putative molybdopterin biosynthesis protein
VADHRRAAAAGHGPGPEAAYAQWIAACAKAGWRGQPAAEQVPVSAALGRVTAAPVLARLAAPRAACAAMDGIAIRVGADDATETGRRLLPAGAFTWIDTGEPLPPGTDTVVERERVEAAADGGVWVTGPAATGLHVRAEGEDFPAGELLIPAGHRLRPADVAIAATAGHVLLECVRGPVSALIPTGNEIRPIGAELGHGDIIDSNSLLLAARATEAGARPVISDVQPDRPEAIAAEVRRAAAGADLVLIIAGSSAGRRDYTATVLAEVGRLAVRGVAVRPGHPVLLGYATRGDTAVPAIGVPGYPLAAAVIFELFAIPLLAALQGCAPPERPCQRVQLACDWTSPPEVEDWVPVTLDPPPGVPGDLPAQATPGRRGASAISRLTRAHAWWPIPIGQAKFVRGEYIDVQPIPGTIRWAAPLGADRCGESGTG